MAAPRQITATSSAPGHGILTGPDILARHDEAHARHPEPTRSSIIVRLLDHAEKNWPQLAKVRARYHGSFAYITGVLRDGEQIPLFRLRYGGSAHSFGFAIYSPARDRYEDAVLLTGLPIGSPQEALDTACTVHLTGFGHEPEP